MKFKSPKKRKIIKSSPLEKEKGGKESGEESEFRGLAFPTHRVQKYKKKRQKNSRKGIDSGKPQGKLHLETSNPRRAKEREEREKAHPCTHTLTPIGGQPI